MKIFRKINDKLIDLDVNHNLGIYAAIYVVILTVLSVIYVPFIILLFLGGFFTSYMCYIYLYGDFNVTLLLYPKKKNKENE